MFLSSINTIIFTIKINHFTAKMSRHYLVHAIICHKSDSGNQLFKLKLLHILFLNYMNRPGK
jgi:hypothetical protein